MEEIDRLQGIISHSEMRVYVLMKPLVHRWVMRKRLRDVVEIARSANTKGGIRSPLLKKGQERRSVLREMVDTEALLLQKLTVLHDNYLQPIQRYHDGQRGSVGPDDGKATRRPSGVAPLFSLPASYREAMKQLTDMIGFSKGISEKLEHSVNAVEEPSSIAPIMAQVAHKVSSVYSKFIARMTSISWAHNQASKLDPEFKKFLLARKKAAPRGMSIELLLILPVQRSIGYKALLDRLIKNTDESHIEYKQLRKA